MIEENILYNIPLPSFLISFKDQIVQSVVPYLHAVLRIVQSNGTSQISNSADGIHQKVEDITIGKTLIALLVVVIALQIMILLCSGLFTKGKAKKMDSATKNTD